MMAGMDATPDDRDAAAEPTSDHGPASATGDDRADAAQQPPDQPAKKRRMARMAPRTWTMMISGGIAAVLFLALAVVPVPYVVEGPGPTCDTLHTCDGKEVITIKGTQTYPSSGQLRMVTVSVYGGPGSAIDMAQTFGAWISGQDAVLPEESVYPPHQTGQEREQQDQAQFDDSQQEATMAALSEVGIEVPTTITVQGTVSGSGADGVLKKGDVLVAVDGHDLTTYDDLDSAISGAKVGQVVPVTVQRDGTDVTENVTITADDSGNPRLGVEISTDPHYPFEIDFDLQGIGGPSAGMMFALGIVDKLTPGDMTGGKDIAGTGTIDAAGTVGAIGGIDQKMMGAKRDGADYFLAPKDNCSDVVGHIPDGMQVFSVSTLHQAHQTVEAIGQGKTSGLATCS